MRGIHGSEPRSFQADMAADPVAGAASARPSSSGADQPVPPSASHHRGSASYSVVSRRQRKQQINDDLDEQLDIDNELAKLYMIPLDEVDSSRFERVDATHFVLTFLNQNTGAQQIHRVEASEADVNVINAYVRRYNELADRISVSEEKLRTEAGSSADTRTRRHHRPKATTPDPVASIGNSRSAAQSGRHLTLGESRIVSTLFGDSIDSAAVKIYNRSYIPLLPNVAAMAPDGHVYFRPRFYRHDFSVAEVASVWQFVHELTHVWQHGLGYPVKRKGAMFWRNTYVYKLGRHAKLRHFDMEAQATIIADYYSLKYLNGKGLSESGSRHASLHYYEDRVLKSFLRDPCQAALLPRD